MLMTSLREIPGYMPRLEPIVKGTKERNNKGQTEASKLHRTDCCWLENHIAFPSWPPSDYFVTPTTLKILILIFDLD